MKRLFFHSAILVCLSAFFTGATAIAQTHTFILPGKWSVEQYRDNPDYLQILIDMRSANSKLRVRGVQGTATLYGRGNRYLKTARISVPSGELTPGKIYVHYIRCGVSPVARVYAISAAARVAVLPPGIDPPSDNRVQTEEKEYPNVPLVFDRNLKAPRSAANTVKLLSPRPPRKISGR